MKTNDMITCLVECDIDNIMKLGRIRHLLKDKYLINIPVNELIYCFSEDKVSERGHFTNSDTFALLGDKILDFSLFEILLYEFNVAEKYLLDKVRNYTTDKENKRKLSELELQELFFLSSEERRGDVRVKKKQHDSTYEALIFFIYKNLGIDFLKEFIRKLYSKELIEIVNSANEKG